MRTGERKNDKIFLPHLCLIRINNYIQLRLIHRRIKTMSDERKEIKNLEDNELENVNGGGIIDDIMDFWKQLKPKTSEDIVAPKGIPGKNDRYLP